MSQTVRGSEKTLPHTSSEGDAKTNVTGESDLTLIGNQQATTYDDAVGIRSSGIHVDRVFDPVTTDEELMTTLKPPEEVRHSIETILSRPVKLETVSFNSTQQPGDEIAFHDITSRLRYEKGFQLAREKLSGFYGFRCTAHFRVVLNPQPFESGLFMIWFNPLDSISQRIVVPPEHEMTLPYATGCPSVICNINLQSDVELSVPYTSCTPFINMTDSQNLFGAFRVSSIVPLQDGTNAANCEMTLYMYFTDVELFGATAKSWAVTGIPMMPQALNSQVERRSRQDQKSEDQGFMQVLGSSLRNVGSSGIDSVLKLIGLSKPTQDQAVARVIVNPYSLQPTADSVTGATKYSLSREQGCVVNQLGIDKMDEMDINYIISKPTYLKQFNWKVGDEPGKLLTTIPVEPNAFLMGSYQGRPFAAPTRLRFIASMFEYWRGTNAFTFYVAATKFHSGRLRFVYSLGGQLDDPERYPYAFSQIVDLRDGTIFKVSCPYFGSTPWRYVPNSRKDTSEEWLFTLPPLAFGDESCYLQIFVENALRANENVTDTVSIAILQAGEEDYEFAGPRAPAYPSFLYETALEEEHIETMTPQSWNADHDIVSINMCSDVDIERQPKQVTSSMFGETVRNLREMIKRYHYMGAWKNVINKTYMLFPWAVSSYQGEGTYHNVTDWLTYIWPLYRFYRGGMRYQFVTSTNTSNQLMIRFDPNINTYGYAMNVDVSSNTYAINPSVGIMAVDKIWQKPFLGTATTPISATTNSHFGLQGGQELELPYYCRFPKCPTLSAGVTLTPVSIAQTLAPPCIALIENLGDEKIDGTTFVYRSAADDFNMGYLLGAPFIMMYPVV